MFKLTGFIRTARCAVVAALVMAVGRDAAGQPVVFLTDTTISETNTQYDGFDVTVRGCTVTINGAHSFQSLTIERSPSNVPGIVTHSHEFAAGNVGGMQLTVAGNVTVQGVGVGGLVASRIDLSGRGHLGGSVPFASGEGPGGGGVPGGAGGGGHGGPGGHANGNASGGGGVYDSITEPIQLGSGSGKWGGTTAGPGGGAIRLVVGGTLQLDGSILADGGSADAGGAGGSIWLDVGTISGGGTVSANGGNAIANTTDYGGGGGGRVAIHFDNNNFGGTVRAYGGDLGNRGGPGTIARKVHSDLLAHVTLDNGGRGGAQTPVSEAAFKNVRIVGTANVRFESPITLDGSLTVDNANLEVTGHNNIGGDLQLLSNANLFHPSGQAGLHLSVEGVAEIDATSRIDLTGRGFPRGGGPGVGSAASPGGGAGGGHGGRGGNNAIPGGGGATYGSETRPITLGSGAGAWSNTGASGGGAVHLTVVSGLTLNGDVKANGGISEPNAGGGGAGGSIWIEAASISGSGRILARGGNATINTDSYGSGGGGRIALYSCDSQIPSTLALSAEGGTGGNAGQPGTIRTFQIPLAVQQQPADSSVCSGQTASFTIQAEAGAGGPINYEWQFETSPGVFEVLANGPTGTGSMVSGADSQMLQFAQAGSADAKRYRCRVSNGCNINGVFSNVASLSVGVVITANPLPASICAGMSHTFAVEATGGSALTYQWFAAGNPPMAVTAPSSSPDYVIPYVGAEDDRNYFCRMTGCGTPVDSAEARLTVQMPPTVTITGPVGGVVCVGQPCTFQATPTGTPPLALQWKKNGQSIDGATAEQYTFTAIDATGNAPDSYTCCVSNMCTPTGCASSAPVLLTVVNPPTIETSVVSGGACIGAPILISATVATGLTTPPTFQWHRTGGGLPSGAVASVVSVQGLPRSHKLQLRFLRTAEVNGSYFCTFTTPCGDAVTQSVTVSSGTQERLDWLASTASVPSYFAADRHAMAYDQSRNRIVRFGGRQAPANAGQLGALWEFDGSTWSQISAFPYPDSRRDAAMAYHAATGVTVLYGGADATGSLLFDTKTWIWNGASWSDMTGFNPGRRMGHAMVYDSTRQRTVLFGGITENGGNSPAPDNKTWEWNGTSWHEIQIPLSERPSRRTEHAMAFDSLRHVVVLFGGQTSAGKSAETWECDGTTWRLRASGGPDQPWARAGHSMAFDAARGRTVLHGGAAGLDSETWEWDGDGWQRLDIASLCPGMDGAMVFDTQNQRIVVVGGGKNLSSTTQFLRCEPFDSDSDGDGFVNAADNCPSTFNPDQDDKDNDGVGNACDACANADDHADADGDGIPDACDNCPNTSNPMVTDQNGMLRQPDADSDGRGDACDNCPASPNADQTDLDQDGLGDACDNLIDSDGDGLADNLDLQPNTPSADFAFGTLSGSLVGPALPGSSLTANGLPAIPGTRVRNRIEFIVRGRYYIYLGGAYVTTLGTIQLGDDAFAPQTFIVMAGSTIIDCIDGEAAAEFEIGDQSIRVDIPAGSATVLRDNRGPGNELLGVEVACFNAALVAGEAYVSPGESVIFGNALPSDRDHDGITDSFDNCPETANPDQADADGDGVGDACDNCAVVPNTQQRDRDQDGVGDNCQVFCRGDFNLDFVVDSQDFFDFLDAFFNADADVNGDDTTDSQDYFDFLEAFFTGC